MVNGTKNECKNSNHYNSTAAQRTDDMEHTDLQSRKRKSTQDEDQLQHQPVYLRKVFAMINSCPDDIGSWSESGETFSIKNVHRFEKEIIPTVFKQSKFSSFVRQLNFCKH